MISGHQFAGGATPTPDPGIGSGLNQNGADLKMAANTAVTAEDIIYKIATVTAVISLLASVF